jgi:phage terminase large subunit-like protein
VKRDLEEFKKLSALLQAREEERKLEFFHPNGKQEDFIKLVGSGDKFICLFVGGNGVGKTALLANVLGNIIWGPQNDYFKGLKLFEKFTYPKRIRIGTESKNVETIGSIDQEITKWWPKGRYEGFKAGKMFVSQYKTDNGFLIDKMSYEQERKEWESATLGVACFDEPPPKEIFAATVSRLRQGGVMLFYMTPLMDSAWIQDELVDVASKDTGVVFCEMEDNCKEHGVRGILEHRHIEKMIENMDPDEKLARSKGQFMHLSNVILGGAFKREIHIVGNDYQPQGDATWGMCVDPAAGKPWAMCWFWVDGRGQVCIDSEYPMDDFTKMKESRFTTKDYIEIMHNIEGDKKMEWRILDRHFGNQRNFSGRTLKMDLNDGWGMDFIDSYNCEEELEIGINKVKSYLRINEAEPLSTSNFPKLVIKDRCRNVIRSLDRWRRDAKMQPERLSPYKDHFDLVRYIVMSEPEVYRYKPLPPPRQAYAVGRI